MTSQVILNHQASEDLQKALQQSERAVTLMSGREIRIRQIKNEINLLSQELGRGKIYNSGSEPFSADLNQKPGEKISMHDFSMNALSLAEDAEIARRETIEINEQLSIIKQAVNSSSDAIAISNAVGNFFYLNHTFSELFGYNASEMLLLANELFFTETDIAHEAVSLCRKGITWRDRTEVFTKDGAIIPVFLRVAPFSDEENTTLGMIWNFTDISEQIKTEEKIQIYTRRIEMDLVEKENMLQKARYLQRSFIQSTLPIMKNMNVYGLFMPCEILGGDFFLVQKGISENKMIIVIGDCTDHGLKASMDASLLSSITKKHFASLYMDNRTDLLLNKVSTEFSIYADDDQFPTMFAA